MSEIYEGPYSFTVYQRPQRFNLSMDSDKNKHLLIDPGHVHDIVPENEEQSEEQG